MQLSYSKTIQVRDGPLFIGGMGHFGDKKCGIVCIAHKTRPGWKHFVGEGRGINHFTSVSKKTWYILSNWQEKYSLTETYLKKKKYSPMRPITNNGSSLRRPYLFFSVGWLEICGTRMGHAITGPFYGRGELFGYKSFLILRVCIDI